MSRTKAEWEATSRMVNALTQAGVTYEDAWALRKISMTLQRWFEGECGNSDIYGSWCIVRGAQHKAPAEWAIKNASGAWWDGEMWTANTPKHPLKLYTSTEKAAFEAFGIPDDTFETAEWIDCAACRRDFVHNDDGTPFIKFHPHQGPPQPRYTPIPDREKGARKHLAKIMAKYPNLRTYIQSDPRGCALYVLRPGDVPSGEDVSGYYSRGVAVHR